MKTVLLITPRTLFLALVFFCVAVAAVAGALLGSTATLVAAVAVCAIVSYFAGALRAPPW